MRPLNKNIKKKKEIKIDEHKTIPTIDLAIKYLRTVIDILIHFPKYLEPKKIDEELLLSNEDEKNAI